MFNPSSPLTGAAITGLTTPTYTFVADTPPDANSKAWVVTALGGTQTGVIVHKNEMPFRIIVRRASRIKTPGARSTTTGQFLSGGKNEYEILLVKGCNVLNGLNGAQYENILIRARVSVPVAAGNDSSQLDAAFSFFGGFLSNQLQGWRDTSANSVL